MTDLRWITIVSYDSYTFLIIKTLAHQPPPLTHKHLVIRIAPYNIGCQLTIVLLLSLAYKQRNTVVFLGTVRYFSVVQQFKLADVRSTVIIRVVQKGSQDRRVKWCPNGVQMVSKWCPNGVQG